MACKHTFHVPHDDDCRNFESMFRALEWNLYIYFFFPCHTTADIDEKVLSHQGGDAHTPRASRLIWISFEYLINIPETLKNNRAFLLSQPTREIFQFPIWCLCEKTQIYTYECATGEMENRREKIFENLRCAEGKKREKFTKNSSHRSSKRIKSEVIWISIGQIRRKSYLSEISKKVGIKRRTKDNISKKMSKSPEAWKQFSLHVLS